MVGSAWLTAAVRHSRFCPRQAPLNISAIVAQIGVAGANAFSAYEQSRTQQGS